MTFIEQFVKYWAHRCAERITVERVDDTTVRIALGERAADVSMDQLIVKEDALRAIGAAVDGIFGVKTEPDASEGASHEA